MPNINIPPEILLKIFAHVRDIGGPNFHLDLLSCSVVSRCWFDCAWPLAAEFFNQEQPLDLDAYSVAQLDSIVDAITKLRQLGVWKATLLTSVVTTINMHLFEQTTHGSRADVIVRLVHTLQSPSKALNIYIPYCFDATNIQKFVSKLYSDTTSLHITGGRYSEQLQPLKPLERLSTLIYDLRHQLQDVTTTETDRYPPSFTRALSKCPNIRNVSIENSPFNFVDLSAAMFSWPELRSLKILGTSSEIDLIVEQLAMNTPKHLESLHLEYCKTPQLRNLIISLAPRLVYLAFPSAPSGNSDEFLDLITSLDMPCLRHLDLSRLANSLTAENVVQRHWVEGQGKPMSLSRWPKLQRINLSFCFKISPLFLELVMASCPALEGVRFGRGFFAMTDELKWLEDSETIWADSGWTRSTRHMGRDCVFVSWIVVTYSKPGGNVWEVEEWVEEAGLRTLSRKFGPNDIFRPKKRISEHEEVDGVVIVHCIKNESA